MSNRLSSAVAVVVSGLMAASALAQTPTSYSIQQAGLTGPGYTFTGGPGNFTTQFSQAIGQTPSGQIAGFTTRRSSTNVILGQDSWRYGNGSTTLLQLFGSEYQYVNQTNGLVRNSTPLLLNDAGNIVGTANRYNAAGDDFGRDVWQSFSGASVNRLGLTGTGYDITTTGGPGAGTRRTSDVVAQDAFGTVLGSTNRQYAVNPNSGSYGRDAWVGVGTTTTLIGLQGAGYEFAEGGTGNVTRDGRGLYVDRGYVAGITQRYTAQGFPLGQDAWRYNGLNTSRIGLIGGVYDSVRTQGTYRLANVDGVNTFGDIIGSTARYTGTLQIGQDAWIDRNGTTTAIGLTGSPYEVSTGPGSSPTSRLSQAEQINDNGKVIGYTRRSNGATDLGQDAWIADSLGTTRIGLTGSRYDGEVGGSSNVIARTGQAQFLNAANRVGGYTQRRSQFNGDLGQDAWVYNGSVTQRVGLSGGVYESPGGQGTVVRFSEIERFAENSDAAGISQRRSGNFTVGQDVFFARNGVSQLASLSGGVYEYVAGAQGGGVARDAQLTDLNESGQVIGINGRFSSTGGDRGQSGFFFDVDTGVISELAFSIRSSDQYSFTQPQVLTEEGVVLGTYTEFNGTTSAGNHAFWWSAEAGFYDLGDLVTGGLTPTEWATLADVYEDFGAAGAGSTGSPLQILGRGLIDNQTTGQSLYVLTQTVPEPTSLTLLAAGGLLLRRRR